MDPMFLSYTGVNGVPQDSKLAQYMKRQTEGPPLGNTLPKSLSNLSLNDSIPLSLKKVSTQAAEFIPRNSGSPLLAGYASESPLTVGATTPLSNTSPTPTVPTYQENVGGTTYFYPAATNPLVSDDGTTVVNESGDVPSTSLKHTSVNDSYFVSSSLRIETQRKNAVSLVTPDLQIYPDLPAEVDNYHELLPLEPLHSLPKNHSIPYQTTTYKATHLKTNQRYCLRRVHNFRLPNSKCMIFVDMWKKLSHSNVVQLKEVFTTKAFGDHSMIFVYDYHPDSETLLTRHFPHTEILNGYSDSFSSNPNAPRPYSHQKNQILRQQHSNGMLPESLLWSYVIQLTGALCVVHAANLACRCLDASKVIHSGRGRLRISSVGIIDVITFDSASATNPLAHIAHYQQDDLYSLGKLLLALACRSLMSVQRDNIHTSVELMSRSYSSDLRTLIISLLNRSQRLSIVDLMPLIGARYYSQLDTIQVQNDTLFSELAKEMENGRLCRLLVKLGTINERPEFNMDPTWSETGDRYMLKLFRDHLFHQVTEDGRPFLDMAHVIQNLNKLDAGVSDKVLLMSRDEQSILVVTYAELKHCLDQSFNEIAESSTSPAKTTQDIV